MAWLESLREWYFKYGFGVGIVAVMFLGGANIYWWAESRSGSVREGEVRVQESVVLSEKERGDLDVDGDQAVGCDQECVRGIVREEMLAMEIGEKQLEVTPTPSKTVVASSTKVVETKEEMIRLSDGGSAGGEWVSVGSGTWIDTALYGQLVEASWSGWAEIPGGSGIGRVRLYDATNNRAVDGSEVMVRDVERASFYSGRLSIWRGQNQYFIQVKSDSGGRIEVKEAKMKLLIQ